MLRGKRRNDDEAPVADDVGGVLEETGVHPPMERQINARRPPLRDAGSAGLGSSPPLLFDSLMSMKGN